MLVSQAAEQLRHPQKPPEMYLVTKYNENSYSVAIQLNILLNILPLSFFVEYYFVKSALA